jgi:hypothetical protein
VDRRAFISTLAGGPLAAPFSAEALGLRERRGTDRMCDERIARLGAELVVPVTRHVRRTLDVLRGRIPDDE